MGLTSRSLAVLVILSLLLSGCTAPQEEEESRHVPQGTGCPDSDPQRPLPPDEQEVGSVEGLQCAGQYVVLEEGSGARWDVPSWRTNESWTYEAWQYNAPEPYCAGAYEIRVTGNTTAWDQEVYEVNTTNYLGCEDPDPMPGGPSMGHWTKDSVLILHDTGYVHRETLFPLQEGKRWGFVNTNADFLEVTVSHEPAFDFNDSVVEAWRLEFMGPDGHERIQWWGVEAGNMLEEERWTDGTLWNGRILVAHGR